MSEKSGGTNNCDQCHAPIVQGAVCCMQCGKLLGTTKNCIRCHSLIPYIANFCPYCMCNQTEISHVQEKCQKKQPLHQASLLVSGGIQLPESQTPQSFLTVGYPIQSEETNKDDIINKGKLTIKKYIHIIYMCVHISYGEIHSPCILNGVLIHIDLLTD